MTLLTTLRAVAAAAALFALATPAAAQVIDLQAGSSSLFDAHGGSIGIRGRTSDLTIGFGTLQGRPAVGFRVTRTIRNLRLSAGDEFVDFQLPTDALAGARYVPIRGAGVEVARGPMTFHVFGGSTSERVGAPFFQGATWDQPMALAFADLPRGRHWRFTSQNAVGRRVTSIQSAEWRTGHALSLAGSAGVGADRPYAATSVTLEQPWISSRVGYTAQGAGFRRIEAASPMAGEVERENIAITLHPSARWTVTGSRQHFVDVIAAQDDGRRASVNQMGGSINVSGTRLNTMVFDAVRDGTHDIGFSTSAGRRFGARVDAGVDYFRDASPNGVTQSAGGRLQETVHPRLSLLQVVSYNAGGWSLNAGGQFISNPITVDVGYQTVYAPFSPSSPFVRAMTIDARVQLLGIGLQAGTYVTPDGRLRYTVRGTRFLYGRGHGPQRQSSFEMGAYLVRGVVQDERGHGVEGVVLQIGGETTISDRTGRFYVRGKKPRTAPVHVEVTEPTATGFIDVRVGARAGAVRAGGVFRRDHHRRPPLGRPASVVPLTPSPAPLTTKTKSCRNDAPEL